MIIRMISLFFFAVLIGGCAAKLPTDVVRKHSYAYTATHKTVLGKAVQPQVRTRQGESGFYLLGNGLDAFLARAVLARLAQQSLDVQYYLYHDDMVGKLFTDQLVQAADRGVRVRLLVDDMDLQGRDMGAVVLDYHPNIEVRMFNPFSRDTSRLSQLVTRMGSVTRRMHNKSFTADNQVTILGGRNIGNEYFAASPTLAFEDLDVMAVGPVVKDVSVSFDKYWNSDLSYPATALAGKSVTQKIYDRERRQLSEFIAAQSDSLYLKAVRASNLANKIREEKLEYAWGRAKVIYDRPEKITADFDRTEFHLVPQLAPYLEKIKKELIIFSPYFVPGEEGTAFLTDLVKQGVSVKILTNSLASTDVSIVHSGYARYRKSLLRGGVHLYEMSKHSTQKEKPKVPGGSKASLHAKSFVFDRTVVFIGSLNLDPRSVVHNTEIGVLFSSPDIAGNMGRVFDSMSREKTFRLELVKHQNGTEHIIWHGMVDKKPVTYDVEPHTSFWKRLGVGFMRFLPIESQL